MSSDHDDHDCPYFWMWLLDGLPLPIVLVVVFILILIWLLENR